MSHEAQVREDLGYLRGRMDSVLEGVERVETNLKDHMDAEEGRIESLDTRIRKVERKQSWMEAKITSVATVATLIVTQGVSKLLGR